jgi:hypothetical protein
MPLLDEDVNEMLSRTVPTAQENREHFEDNIEEYEEKYGGQLIAIFDKDVVATVDDPTDFEAVEQLHEDLRRKYGDDAQKAYVTQVGDSETVFVI